MNGGWCIGGPMAGTWYHGAERVFKAGRVPTMADASQPVAVAEVAHVTEYTERSFHTPSRDFRFWAPRELTDAQVMDLLIRGYNQNCARGKRP